MSSKTERDFFKVLSQTGAGTLSRSFGKPMSPSKGPSTRGGPAKVRSDRNRMIWSGVDDDNSMPTSKVIFNKYTKKQSTIKKKK